MKKIYGIYHPVTMQLVYVGCTKSPLNVRLSNHLAQARRRKTKGRMIEWVRGLLQEGLRPKIYLIDHADGPAGEGFYIKYFSSSGIELLNEQVPGEYGWARHNSLNKRVSLSLKGRRRPRDVVEKINAANRGKHDGPLSLEHSKKISEALRGRTFSPEHRLHLSEAALRRYAH